MSTIVAREAQIVASLLNLEQCYNSLYELKFKGKKMIEELANSLYERDIMIENRRPSAPEIEVEIFSKALMNCDCCIGEWMGKFEMSFV